jgi:hypothetical protein
MAKMVLQYATSVGDLRAHREARIQIEKRMRQLEKFEGKLVEALEIKQS